MLLGDELADAILGHVARLGDARHLEQRGLRRDVGIEAAGGGGDEVDRHGAEGFSAFSFSTSSLTRSFSALLVGPRLEPPELAAL